MTVETDLSCEVSYCSCSCKVELEEKSKLNLDLDLNVCEDQGENVCDTEEGEVKVEGEGENGAYVMVGGGGEAVVDENVSEQEDNLESVEEKDEEELHEETGGNVESGGERSLSFEGEAEHVDDDDQKNVSVDDENVEIVDDVEKIECVDDDIKIEEEMKLDNPVVDDLNSIKEVDEEELRSGESDLVAEIKDSQENEKLESFEEEVEKQVYEVMVSQNFEFEELQDDDLVNEFKPLPPTKEDGLKLEMDICEIGDSSGTSHESSEVTEEVKEEVDSSYVFVDGTEAVCREPLEAEDGSEAVCSEPLEGKPVIGDMTNLGLVTQTEESPINPHFLVIGTVQCGVPHYTSSAMLFPASSGDKISPCCSVDNAKPEIGMATFFPDQSGYLPTSSSSDFESSEAINPVGDGYLESEVGTGSNRSNKESTPNSCGDTSDEKKRDEKMEEKAIFRYLIKFPRYFDDKVEEQIVQAQQQIGEMTRKRDAIIEEVQAQKATCKEYRDKFEAAKLEEAAAYAAQRVKRQEMDSVQSMLKSIKSAFTVEEIGHQIRSMQHRIEHETIPLKEEKQLIKEMKSLKLHHQQLCSNMDKQAETQPAVDQFEPLEERLTLLKKDWSSVRNEILRTEEITKAAKKVYYDENEKLRNMQERFRSANVLRQEGYARVQKLKKQLYEKNKYFRMYKEDARKAEAYNFSGDKEALNSHCVNQVEKFMELWNNDDGFRNEYLRLNRRSTLRRLHTSKVLSLGNVEPFIPWKVREKVAATPQAATDRDSIPAVSTSGQEKSVSPLEHKRTEEKPTIKTIEKNEAITIVLESSAATVPDKGETEEADKHTEEEKEQARREKECAAAKIREQILLEERTKAKEAEERKRRNTEKAQARAELKAQKEAEQKEKARAKRERKKSRKNATKETNENEPSAPNPETSMPEPTTQEPEVEEKHPKVVSKRNRRPSILAKQAKGKITPLPPPLRNKNKKRMQPWMLGLLTLLITVVAAVIFLPNLKALYKSLSKV